MRTKMQRFKTNTWKLCLLVLIITVVPAFNWHIQDKSISNVLWRFSLMLTFLIGYFWGMKKEIENDEAREYYKHKLENENKSTD